MMMYWVEIVDAGGEVLLRSSYFTRRKQAEAKRIEMQQDPLLQSHPTAHVFIRFELSDPEQEGSK